MESTRCIFLIDDDVVVAVVVAVVELVVAVDDAVDNVVVVFVDATLGLSC